MEEEEEEEEEEGGGGECEEDRLLCWSSCSLNVLSIVGVGRNTVH
jgi:hypothetical protein